MTKIEKAAPQISPDVLQVHSAEIEMSRTDRGYRLETEQRFARPIDEVFHFFSDAANLEMITPDYLRFSIETRLPIEMRKGALIDYRLRLHHVPIKWRTEISAWNPPNRFVDEQLQGPYKFWHHEHQFEECDGMTTVTDIVDYGVTLGVIVHPLLVSHDLRRIFAYRRAVLAAYFA